MGNAGRESDYVLSCIWREQSTTEETGYSRGCSRNARSQRSFVAWRYPQRSAQSTSPFVGSIRREIYSFLSFQSHSRLNRFRRSRNSQSICLFLLLALSLHCLAVVYDGTLCRCTKHRTKKARTVKWT